ncbi:MAG TPA: restriction endonuclease subunit S, partial [Candidatus Hydrogenedentes bacterium]|nr:restriction endonuclease subunit S [Candidatus Hydrogenedentota bacterium]
MGNEWREVSLASICREVRYGYTASATDKPTATRFLRVTDIVSGSINWNNVRYCEISEKEFARYRLIPG